MGYANPLHGLDSEGNPDEARWETTGKGNESTMTEKWPMAPDSTILPVDGDFPEALCLNDQQALRVLALQQARSVLTNSFRSLHSQELMNVADFILQEDQEPETQWRYGLGWLARVFTKEAR